MYFSFNFAWDSIELGFVYKEQRDGGEAVYLTNKTC